MFSRNKYSFLRPVIGLILVLFFAVYFIFSSAINAMNVQVKDERSELSVLFQNRKNKHEHLSSKIALLSDQELVNLLGAAHLSGHVGVGGGIAGTIYIDGNPVFFKMINLTELENRPENFKSTKNLFELPTYYQYGIGSAGFGAWRELFVHELTTKWVLAGKCPHFPLMYHWRILPREVLPPTNDELKLLDECVEYWEGSAAIRERVLAIHQAPHQIVLFLEHFPETLHSWIQKMLGKDDEAVATSVEMVEDQLRDVVSFMKSQRLLHFDGHFKNILTDGHLLYFTDFGLSISSQFELSQEELIFFNNHQDYDYQITFTNLITEVLSFLFKEQAEDVLREIAFDETGEAAKIKIPSIAPTMMRYVPTAISFLNWLIALEKNKQISFNQLAK